MNQPISFLIRPILILVMLMVSPAAVWGQQSILERKEKPPQPSIRKPTPISPAQIQGAKPTPLKSQPANAPAPTAAKPDAKKGEVRIPPDFEFSNLPTISKAEAYPGIPFGVGRIRFRMRSGDEMVLRTGAALLTERNNRIFYPVMTKSQVKTFLQTVTGRASDAPDDQHTIWFLFKGNQPLELRLDGSDTSYQAVPTDPTRANRYSRFMEVWWREYEQMARKQMDWGDYPGVVETYVTSMLRKRLGFPLSKRQLRKRDELGETVDLLFDVETLRNEAIQRAMEGRADNSVADQEVPPSISWSPVEVTNMPENVPVEPFAQSIPEECFYLRFGTWQNQIWLQKLMEEFGGDLGRMIQLRGYRPKIQSKFLDQLAIQSTEFDRLFGGRLIDDVAVIGMDAYFDEGATIGVMLHAKNSDALKGNLVNKRKRFVADHEKDGATLQTLEHNGEKIQFVSTPDNRYRSFYVVQGDNHLVCTSLNLARRFIEASAGDRSLATSDEYRYARAIMPLEREDTVFVYLSTKFFQQLLGPKYQIELRRRNRVISDMQLLEAARLAASYEGLDPDDIDTMVRQGFLPERFGQRSDGSQIVSHGMTWKDSIRGRPGFFTPIADMEVNAVSQDEYNWFVERATYFSENITSLDPMVVALKRFDHETEKNVERVIFDARVAPFGEEKYGWLINRLGPPLKQQVVTSPDDIVSLQASLVKDAGREGASPHQVFAAVQDQMDPNVDLKPTTALQIYRTLRETPGYIGSWPNAGYLDFLPAFSGVPDPNGFLYSRFLSLWRMYWGEFSVVGFDQQRLENLKSTLAVKPTERAAQIRLVIGDLRNSKLQSWANAINYRRSWQTSVANAKLLNMLTQQFGISPELTLPIAEQMLNVDLVCSLGGEYRLYELKNQRQIWGSDSWPSFTSPKMPEGYVAPMLKWFRGAELEVTKAPTQFAVHGHVDIERQASEPAVKLPSFEMLKGFSNMFGVGAKKTDKKTKPESDKK